MAEIRLVVRGKSFGGWKSATVTRSIEAVAGAFEVSVSEKFPERPSARELRAGDEVSVLADGETVLTGYIDERAISSEPNGVQVTIRGRDRTGDLADATPDLSPGEWTNVSLLRMAQILAEPFDVPVRADADLGPRFPKVALNPGETAWDLLEELARYRAVVAMSDGQGGLLLTSGGAAGRGEALVYGQNLLRSALNVSHVNRYSVYIVRGQSAGTDFLSGIAAAGPEGRALDEAITRNRPLIIVAGSSVDAGRAAKRARYEATVRAGRAERVSCHVQGWRQSGGALWRPNLTVPFENPVLGVKADLVISRATLRSTPEETTTTLDLIRPEAFVAAPEPVVEDTGLGFQ